MRLSFSQALDDRREVGSGVDEDMIDAQPVQAPEDRPTRGDWKLSGHDARP